jgi:hypothetical protein
MKKFAKYLVPAMLVGLVMLLAGCGDTVVSNDTAANVKGTLQGKIMDATTGKAISDAKEGDTKVYLVKGTQQIAAQKLNTYVPAGSDKLPGEYAITNIPVEKVDAGGNINDAVYKVVVIKAGYQPFEAEFSFQGDYAIGAAGQPTFIKEADYNKIGNIYLFPLGATAPDYTVTVKFNGKAVAGANVRLIQNLKNNVDSTEVQPAAGNQGLNALAYDSNRLTASLGLYPNLSGTSDANGKVAFKGADLTLGGRYSVVVDPCKDADGVQLAQTMGNVFVVGANAGVASEISQTVTMNTLWAGDNANGLYVATVSTNTTAGTLLSTGVLTLTFSRPVEINNNGANIITGAAAPFTAVTVNGYTANVTGGAAQGISFPALDTAAHAALKPVVAALSSDGLTLTLTPSWATAPVSTDYNLAVTYGGFTGLVGGGISFVEPTISVKGFPAKQYTLFGTSGTQLLKSTGAAFGAADAKVNMIGPRP